VITQGWWPIRGLAWSGRGKITRVEVRVDNGNRRTEATLLSRAMPHNASGSLSYANRFVRDDRRGGRDLT
jgi:hypothetical protein